jgi:kinesin family protein 2/24
MGNSESSANPVRNLDKRTARREYATRFIGEIDRYRAEKGEDDDLRTVDSTMATQDTIQTVVRKRPIFAHELKNSEFDVVTAKDQNRITIHDARMHTDMVRHFMNHHEFNFHRVYSERDSNEDIYHNTIAPMVTHTLYGGYSTCMVYGQTGSGKTFTMSYMYERAARELFQNLPTGCSIGVSYIELADDTVLDLLNVSQPVQLCSGGDGCFHAYPVVEPIVNSLEELLALVLFGQDVRATSATGVHDASSRSHSLLRLYVYPPAPSQSDELASAEGVLNLIDLAGSEHRIDSMYHNAERRREGGHINKSLSALKECVRIRSTVRGNGEAKEMPGHHYRKSKLTMLLKGSFTLPSAKTVIIATVSPASKDTEHSLNTLRHACIMTGKPTSAVGSVEEKRFVTGGIVRTVSLGRIDVGAISRENHKEMKKNGSLRELMTSNGNQVDRSTLSKEPPTAKQKEKRRRQLERSALSKLGKSSLATLREARCKLRTHEQQNRRMQGVSTFLQELQNEQTNLSAAEEIDHNFAGSISPGAREVELNGRADLVPVDGELHKCFHANKRTTLSTSPEHRGGPSSSNVSIKRPISPETRAKMKKMRSIHSSVYGDDTIPVSVKRRQFETLMKLKGFSDHEVEFSLRCFGSGEMQASSQMHTSPQQPSPGPTQASSASSPESPPILAPTSKTRHELAKQRREEIAAANANAVATRRKSSVPTKRDQAIPDLDPLSIGSKSSMLDRHANARERRQQLEAERQAARKVSPPEYKSDDDVIQKLTADIFSINDAMEQPKISAATKHGLKKRLATSHAKLKREIARVEKERMRIEEENNKRSPRPSSARIDPAPRAEVPAIPVSRVPPIPTATGIKTAETKLRRKSRFAYTKGRGSGPPETDPESRDEEDVMAPVSQDDTYPPSQAESAGVDGRPPWVSVLPEPEDTKSPTVYKVPIDRRRKSPARPAWNNDFAEP